MLELTQKGRRTQIPQCVRHFLSSETQFSQQNGMTRMANSTTASLCHYRTLELEKLYESTQPFLKVHFAFRFSSYPSAKRNFQHYWSAIEKLCPKRNVEALHVILTMELKYFYHWYHPASVLTTERNRCFPGKNIKILLSDLVYV